jgi:hypothetical protein
MDKPTCTAADCDRPIWARDLCTKHYQRMTRLGSLELNAKPTTQERFYAKVDKTPNCWNWTANMNGRGYGRFHDDSGARIYPHRYSYELHHGPIPDGMVIDHTCHNRACVNPAHLRAITQKQNVENRGVLNRNNTSGYTGVSWNKSNRGWCVKAEHNGRTHNGGTFSNLEDAAEAARRLRISLFTHNDHDRMAG